MDNLSDFEHFYHFSNDTEPVLPFDYVPHYPWWNAEADALWAKRVRYSESLLTSNSPISENRRVTFVTQEPSPKPLTARLMMILARKNIELAAAQLKDDGYSWEEIEPYLRNIQEVAQAFERLHKPANCVFFWVIVRSRGDSE